VLLRAGRNGLAMFKLEFEKGNLRQRARWLPAVAGAAAAIVGLVTLASALTPNISWQGHLLLSLEPVEAVPIFHALALPAGAALLVAARYLAKRRRRAWQLAIVLLLAIGVLDLFKGLDLDETAIAWALAVLLWWGRDAFGVRHEPITVRSAVWRVPAVLLGAVALAAIAVWASAPAHPGLSTVLRETGDLLVLQSGPLRFHGVFSALPVGVGLISVVAFLVGAYLVFRPLAAPRALPDASLRAVAAELVRAHGTDTLSFFKLREDKHYLFSPDRRAFAAYRVEGGVLLLSGDPIGPHDALPGLVARARAFAAERGLKLGAVGVGEQLLGLYEDAGLRSVYIGDEAIVDVAAFSLEGRAIRKVRQSVTRLRKSGYDCELIEYGALHPDTLRSLEAISDAWREGAPERGFSMAMDSLRGEHHDDSLVVIARDGDGEVRGFLHFVPAYRRSAVSLSFMRRDRETPNGLSEFLVAESIVLLRERGVSEVSLNFAAFARWMHSPSGRGERVMGRLVALGNPFFQIESLYRFNAKFFPRWEARYLVYEGALGLPRAGLAAMWAEGQLPKPGVRTPRAA
jgi:lysyl-tRNA synthetase, class II